MTAIEIRPIAGALGAEVHGVDLSETLSNSEFDAVHQAFLDHQVIFFRDQGITPEQHIAFGRRFGELDIHPFADGMEDYPEIIHVLKEAKDHSDRTFGGSWHTDVTFYEKPALGSILYALDVPEAGGCIWSKKNRPLEGGGFCCQVPPNSESYSLCHGLASP